MHIGNSDYCISFFWHIKKCIFAWERQENAILSEVFSAISYTKMKMQRLGQTCLWHLKRSKPMFLPATSTLINHRTYNSSSGNPNPNNNNNYLMASGAAALTLGGLFLYSNLNENPFGLSAEVSKRSTKDLLKAAGARVASLPVYSAEDVGKRSGGGSNGRIWVTYKNGVYDITDFVKEHPGATNILKAAGGPVEPFWETYAVHKNNPEVYEMLEGLRVGNLREEDVKSNASVHLADQFGNEPRRSGVLVATSSRPFNAEPPVEAVVDSFLTPADAFYVRNHLPVPDISADEYELHVGGVGVAETTFSLRELKEKFPKATVTAVIQCGGNRRADMNAEKGLKGLQWKGAAIGNATWSGARLSDVLEHCGFDPEKNAKAKHVQFEG